MRCSIAQIPYIIAVFNRCQALVLQIPGVELLHCCFLAHRDGTLVGDFGFDPLNLGQDPELLRWNVQAELVHGRWAMLAVAGIMFTGIEAAAGLDVPQVRLPCWPTLTLNPQAPASLFPPRSVPSAACSFTAGQPPLCSFVLQACCCRCCRCCGWQTTCRRSP